MFMHNCELIAVSTDTMTNHLIPLCPRLPDWPDIITFITLNWIYSCKKPGIETVRTYSQASAAYLDIRHTVFAV